MKASNLSTETSRKHFFRRNYYDSQMYYHKKSSEIPAFVKLLACFCFRLQIFFAFADFCIGLEGRLFIILSESQEGDLFRSLSFCLLRAF